MNDYAWRTSAILAIVAGILICFWGYRLLKLSLAVIGLVAGAYGGAELGTAWFHSANGAILVCIIVGALIGMLLSLWLYFLGVFLIGATAGTVVAGVVASGAGHQVQPILLLVLPLIFGIIALVAQRIMVSLSTALSGAYLVTAGLWQIFFAGPNPSRVWLFQPQNHPPEGALGYAALGLWIVLALAGISAQLRTHGPKAEPVKQQS